MKNILLIMPYGSVGGMERLALTFYKCYKENGYNVKALKFIQLENDIIHFGEDELFLKKKDFFEMSITERYSFYLKLPFLIRRVIKKHQVTHSIAFGDMANLYSSLTYTKEFKVGSIHALKSVELKNKTFLNSLIKKGFKFSYKNLNKLVCISEGIKKDLLEKCEYRFENNLQVIYNPHNFKSILKSSEEVIENKEERQLFKNYDVILFIGRLSTQKSLWHLVNAFSAVANKQDKAKLVFIGDGDPAVQNYISGQVSKLKLSDKTVFMGRKNNPFKYLKAAKLLALSSHFEGTPNVIVEAISVGTPIVSSNCTEGIFELMSLSENARNITENLETESGIITPNLFKGVLGIPEDDKFIEEEYKLADALTKVLDHNEVYRAELKKHQKELMEKFDDALVSEMYLKSMV